MSGPGLTILVVSYDSRRDLARLLPTIPEGDHEVVVVDNHGADGVADWLPTAFPGVRVIAAGANLGYGAGNNLGLRHTHGERVLILNPDTELRPGALDVLHAVLDDHPAALVTPKIVDGAGRVYACGLELHYTGVAARLAVGDEPAAHRGVVAVPLPSGTAFLATRATLDALGGFDEWYFMYMEDVDLAVRARQAGHPVLCAADAVVVHHSDPAVTSFKFHWLERNRVAMVRKLTDPATFRRLRPGLAVTEAATWAFALLRGPAHVRAKWRARRAARTDRADREAAGHAHRAARKGPDRWLEIAAAELPFPQLVGRGAVARVLAALARPLYSVLRPGNPR